MADIIAPGVRFTCSLACMLASSTAWGSSDAPPAKDYNPLPSGYSLSYDHDRWNEEFSVFQLSVADRIGTIESGFAASADPRLRPLTRLDSSWTFSAPLLSLPTRVGDAVSSADLWEQPARLAGIQLGTAPEAPPPVVAPPSVIDSPYTIGIAQFPGYQGPPPGQGLLQSPVWLAMTTPRFVDLLQSWVRFDQPSLETPGHADYSMESGRLRENFEIRSNDYGSWVTSGMYRYGLAAGTTVDGEVAQVAGQEDYLGLGLLEGIGPAGQVSARVAGSRDPSAAGWLASFGADYNLDRFSLDLRSQIQTPGYQDVGDSAVLESLRQQTLASAGLDLGVVGRVALTSASETYLDDTHRDVVALSHAIPFGAGGILSTAAAYSPSLGSTALWLSFTYPFENRDAESQPSAATSAMDRALVDTFGEFRLPAGHAILDHTGL